MKAPVLVLNTNTKREHGRKAQLGNINAAKSVADIIRTTLGPQSMLKMILDPMGGIVMTNDGNTILREIDVSHPAAKSMIELSRTQDEEVGDGTTSVIILAGELLAVAEPFLQRCIHPRIIVSAYLKVLDKTLEIMDEIAVPLDVKNKEETLNVVRTCLGTKFVSRYGDLVCNMAYDAVKTVTVKRDGRPPEINIKEYAKVEKIPGGMLEDCQVLNGILINKDITMVGGKMRRRIENPRIILLDCGLEYKKAESQTNIEVTKEEDWNAILKMEEEQVEALCNEIIKHKPDLVMTEKGVSDLAQHYLAKAGISVLRRLRKTDNNRVARAVGAMIANEPSELTEDHIGKDCGLFEIRKIGDDYFSYLVECKNPSACTILLRGGSKDVLNEIERNLKDGMGVVRSLFFDPRIVPGGGATEMAIGRGLIEESKKIEDIMQLPYQSVAEALEVIPRTLIENCGGNSIRALTELRAKHAEGTENGHWGIEGKKGVLADMKKENIWDTYLTKSQTIKTSIEAATMLLRIDDIVSGLSNPDNK